MSLKKTSTTAYGVACGMAKLAQLPRWKGYFSEEMAELSAAFMQHAVDSPVKRLAGWLPPQWYIRAMDTFYIPGMVHHFLFRKRLIEDRTLAAIAGGVRQIIILGAGFDTLALRMANAHPEVQFVEIDLPHTQHMKRSILARTGRPLPTNCIFIEADLAEATLETALRDKAHVDPALPTLVILEGVLMYLTESEVRILFTAMHTLFTSQLTVIFGAIANSDDDSWRVRLFHALWLSGKEIGIWHASSQDIPTFVAQSGYALKEWIPYKKLQSFYRSSAEIRSLPVEDENYYLMEKIRSPTEDAPIMDIRQIPFMRLDGKQAPGIP